VPKQRPYFKPTVDDFYAAIERHPDARAAITGGRAQVERLKTTLVAWLESVLSGPYDEKFLAQHSRIGQTHVRIALPQQFMFTAMNRIRVHLSNAIVREYADPAEQQALFLAVHQVLDVELAIMLDTYRENLMEKMRLQERLSTIGQLAATIAHELRNPLGTVESSVFLLQERTKKLGLDDATLDKHHDRILSQVELCGKTITNLLELARGREIRKQAVDPKLLLASTLHLLALPEDVDVDVDIAPDATLHGDADQLRQVLVNLILNAAEALDGAGKIRIRVERDADEAYIDVIDDGPGVPPEAQKRVFEVMFTTKAMGTGLGLSLCQRIVEAHDGKLELLPSERGAHFRIRIPH
jgi:signal transduction histidine kinase